MRGTTPESALRRTYQAFKAWGLDPRATVLRAKGLSSVRRDRAELERQRNQSPRRGDFPLGPAYVITADRHDQAGQASGHYFHQDLYVAREVFRRAPTKHIDVGSSIYGLVSHIASYRELTVLDVRPVDSHIPGIRFVQQDVMNLGSEFKGFADSVSCLHAIEHFGLGRYGDPVDFDGWMRGLDGLNSLLQPGGTLYLSAPTGANQRIEFNAHRVFSLPYLRDVLGESFAIDKLAFVTDDGNLQQDVDPWGPQASRSFDSEYGCSIWILTKQGYLGEKP